MAKYVYPAVFTPESIGGYSINFPDLPHCYTQGDDLKDGYEMAQDILCSVLVDMEDSGQDIPSLTNPSSVQLNGKEFVALIGVDTTMYRKENDGDRIAV